MSLNKITNYFAYLAGFLDGDGSIYVRAKKNSSYKYGFQIAPYIIFFQSKKEENLFKEIFANLNFGYIRERKDGILEYTIARQEDILFLISKVEPFLILKKKQANLIVKIIRKKQNITSEKEFHKLMNLVDEYRNLNYSTNRKRHKLTP